MIDAEGRTVRIIRNSARCPTCEDEIESKHRHDFVSCSCGAVFVDGGKDYLRRGWNTGVEPIESSITEVIDTAERP